MIKKTLSILVFFLFLYSGTAQNIYTQNVFAFIGDYGADNADENAVSLLIKSWNPEAILTLGDNNYPSGSASSIDKNIGKYFHDYIKPYTGTFGPEGDENRFWPSIGNHDVMSGIGAPYYNYFELPNNERYYDFVKGDIHFFCLDSDPSETDGYTENSVQGVWLMNKLQSSTSKWNIVYAHHPPYSSDAIHRNTDYMHWPFKDWGADIVITGHAHTYERLMVDSFPYIVNGLGGTGKYNFGSVQSGSIVRYNQKFGALQLIAAADSLAFRFYTVDHERIDSLFLVKKTSVIGIENHETPALPPKIHPNPTTGLLHLNFKGFIVENNNILITVKDVAGNEMYTENFRVTEGAFVKNLTLPEKFSSGIYFLQAAGEKHQLNTKVVVTR